MVSLSEILFFSAVSSLFVHELDAIRQHEWQFFFASLSVRDEITPPTFTALHAPLFVVVLVYLESPAFQLGFDAFVIFHALLHLGLRNHIH